MNTQELKQMMKNKNVKQWQIAAKIGVSEFTFSRWLRCDVITKEKADLIINAISELVEKDGVN